jgi:hypothetical protein
MTERTVLRETRALQEDDAISITSTQEEEYTSDQEFLVERVLAEKRDANNKVSYLIFWAGYPEEKSTWEPRNNIQDPAILEAWEERKGQEAAGTKPAFDLHGFNSRLAKIGLARVERHQLRKAKRRRLGIQASSSSEEDGGNTDSDSSEAVESNELPGDDIVVKRNAEQPFRSQNEERTARDPDETSDIEPYRTRPSTEVQSEDESDSSSLDNDFIVGDKKKAQRKALQALRQRREQSLRKVIKDDGSKVSGDEDKYAAEKTLDVSTLMRVLLVPDSYIVESSCQRHANFLSWLLMSNLLGSKSSSKLIIPCRLKLKRHQKLWPLESLHQRMFLQTNNRRKPANLTLQLQMPLL